MIVYDCIWLYMIISDCIWLYTIVYDCMCLYMVVYDYLWLYIIVYDYNDSLWLYMINYKWVYIIYGDMWWYPPIYGITLRQSNVVKENRTFKDDVQPQSSIYSGLPMIRVYMMIWFRDGFGQPCRQWLCICICIYKYIYKYIYIC